MKVQKFVDYMKKNTNIATKEEQIVSLAKQKLNIKQYMSINDKRNLIDKIVNESIYYDNGVYKFDGIKKYVCFTMYVIEAYTDIELGISVEDDFDVLSESKLLPVIVCLIQQEYDDINIFLEMQCDYILAENSIESQVGKLLSGISAGIDMLTNKLGDKLTNIDMSELLKDKDQLLEFLATMKK